MARIMNYVPVYDSGKSSDEHLGMERILVDSPESLRAMADDYAESGRKFVAFDTESAARDEFAGVRGVAHALSPEHAFLVGSSVCFRLGRAYYLPFGHRFGKNLPMSVFVDLQSMLLSAGVVFYWNAKHDLKMQRAFGHSEWEKINAFDVSSLVWNMDTNLGSPALKPSARAILGWDLPSYTTAKGKAEDLSWVSPQEALTYAANDALATAHLAHACKDQWKQMSLVLEVDTAVLRPVMELEDTPHPIDIRFVEQLKQDIVPEVDRLRQLMKDLSGDPSYDPGKQAQNKATLDVLARLGVDTGARTSKGVMSLKDEFLKAAEDQHPFVPAMRSFRSLGSLQSKVVGNLCAWYRDDLKGERFQYNINHVNTGRFSSGNGAKNPYYAGFGIQNIKKSKKVPYLVVPGDEMLGYDFLRLQERREGDETLLVLEDGRVAGRDVGGVLAEGYDPKLNVRRAFYAGPGRFFVHADYASEELRIPANLSDDERMVQIFLTGGDMHTMTALQVFGSADDETRKKKAKPFNFGMLFGGTRVMFSRVLNCSESEAQGYIDRWWATYPGLKRWAEAQKAHAKAHGFVCTAFGRRRQLSRYYEAHRADIAERLALNSPVQGTAGDLMRVALVRFKKNLAPKYGPDLKVHSMVHDEVNFGVEESALASAVADIGREMDIRLPGWRVPMEAEFEIGRDWGCMYKFELKDGALVPKGKLVSVGDEKVEFEEEKKFNLGDLADDGLGYDEEEDD